MTMLRQFQRQFYHLLVPPSFQGLDSGDMPQATAQSLATLWNVSLAMRSVLILMMVQGVFSFTLLMVDFLARMVLKVVMDGDESFVILLNNLITVVMLIIQCVALPLGVLLSARWIMHMDQMLQPHHESGYNPLGQKKWDSFIWTFFVPLLNLVSPLWVFSRVQKALSPKPTGMFMLLPLCWAFWIIYLFYWVCLVFYFFKIFLTHTSVMDTYNIYHITLALNGAQGVVTTLFLSLVHGLDMRFFRQPQEALLHGYS